MADDWLGHKCIDFPGGGSGQAESHQVASGRRASKEGAKGVLTESGRANLTCFTVFPGLLEKKEIKYCSGICPTISCEVGKPIKCLWFSKAYYQYCF